MSKMSCRNWKLIALLLLANHLDSCSFEDCEQQKQNQRKQQISLMIDSEPIVMKETVALIKALGLEGLKARIGEKVYKMLAKLKKNNKTINESVVNREDFLQVLEAVNGKGLSAESQAVI